MPSRAADWMEQAERDLQMAKSSADNGYHEWACFAAHQAAEKAIKALHLHHYQEAWGHVLVRLLTDLPVEVPEDCRERARILDNYYIPTRYPNGHAEGAPAEHYGFWQSEGAISHASEILAFVRAEMA